LSKVIHGYGLVQNVDGNLKERFFPSIRQTVGNVAQWEQHRSDLLLLSHDIESSRCFLEQETWPSLHSTG